MAEDEKTRNALLSIRTTISTTLSALKLSVERFPPSPRILRDPVYHAAWRDAILKIEGIRIHLSPARYIARQLNSEIFMESLKNVRSELGALLHDESFLLVTKDRPFRSFHPVGRARPGNLLERALRDKKPSIRSAIEEIIVFIDSVQGPQIAPNTSLRELRKIVPDQKISPVQFTIARGKISILRQCAHPEEEDVQNVEQSRDALLERGRTLLHELQRSNCDRRLLESIKELQKDLESQENIIRLGLMNVGCEHMCGAFEAELPDAIKAMLAGHTRGVAMYVAQFPEWQRFSEKAAVADLGIDDIHRISSTAKKLVADLEAHPQIAESEVPVTITALNRLIENPTLASKRAAYAVLRTIENLISKAFRYSAELIEKSLDKTVEGLSSGMSKIIITTIMSIALTAAVSMSPLSAKIADTGWLKAAAEIARAQIEALEK